ncbi:transposase, partial [Xanthomonas euvesicatoria]|uniref:transposase n=1 Tax=Xanthomonas euvesicatoria TaxID=456327 RepID=UPI001F494AAF
VRTLFLLHYIDDVEVRKTIHAATNKSEEFNGFVKWAFFGGEGGFTPVFTDTYKKADQGHEECSCQSAGSSLPSSSVVRLSRPA